MIGDKIKALRLAKGLSQSQFARKLNVNTKSVKNWENNLSEPSATNLAAIAEFCGVSSDYLIGISDRNPIYLDSLSVSNQKLIKGIIQVFLDQNNQTKE